MKHAVAQSTHPAGLSDGLAEAGLRAIVIVYLLLGALYATVTPAWQAPDEPAHYNYVRFVAENSQLPELRPGDYPHAYLETIKAQRFPPEMAIDSIRYESYQPPAYYVLAAGVYRLASALGDLPMPLTLRAFSLLLGAATLVAGYRLVRAIYPAEPLLALGTVAFMATLPMHLAMTAAVNNDVLAGLLLTVIVWQLVGMEPRDWTRRRALALGALLGLAFLTKLWSYIGFAMALLALAWDWAMSQRATQAMPWRTALARAGIMLGTAFLIALPWLMHNVTVYGPADPLGLARHDQVVAGQLTTRAYLAQHGAPSLLRAFATTTFRSFWGQFGWMGVLLDERIYLALALLSGAALLGFGRYVLCLLRAGESLSPRTRRALALLLAWALLTALGYLAYNIQYVQHQGRYLFFALVPWGLCFMLGLRELLHARAGVTAGLGGILIALILLASLVTGDLKGTMLVLVAGLGVALLAGGRIERIRPGLAVALVYIGMAILAIVCLYGYIVPALRPLG